MATGLPVADVLAEGLARLTVEHDHAGRPHGARRRDRPAALVVVERPDHPRPRERRGSSASSASEGAVAAGARRTSRARPRIDLEGDPLDAGRRSRAGSCRLVGGEGCAEPGGHPWVSQKKGHVGTPGFPHGSEPQTSDAHPFAPVSLARGARSPPGAASACRRPPTSPRRGRRRAGPPGRSGG